MLAFLKFTNSWAIGLRIALAVAAVFAAYLIQVPLETYVTGEPFLLFFAVVMVCAFAFGRSVGFLALATSSLLSTLFFEPHLSFQVSRAADLLALELYTLLGAGSVFAVSQLMNAVMAAYERIAVVERREALLLSEMAHRVANNFASVSTLIRRKAEGISDPEARMVLETAMEQVNVMARVHARLRSEDKHLVLDSRQFLNELCNDLRRSIPADQPITLESSLISTPLGFGQAVLLGLIVNELLTNAVKYAFTDGRRGTVCVNLEGVLDGLLLSVSDNGVGLHEPSKGFGKGRELVVGLSRQLGGKLEIQASDRGTRVQLVLPPLGPESGESRPKLSAQQSGSRIDRDGSLVRPVKPVDPNGKRNLH